MMLNAKKEMWVTALVFLLVLLVFSIVIQNSFK